MRLKTLLAGTAVAIAASFAAVSANAAIVNGSFETGDMTGWSGGFASTNEYGYTPTDGSYLASTYAGCGDGVYCTISQTFTTLGGLFSGDAAFLAHDYLPYNDDAFVSISDGPTQLFFSSIGAVGDYGSSGWVHFTHTLAAGTYTVTAGVRNNGDNGFSSQILVDNFSDGSAAVPEPAAWALMLTGFFGMGAVLRSNRRKAVFAA